MSGFHENSSLASPSTPASASAGPSNANYHASAASTVDGNFSRTTSISEAPASASAAPTPQGDPIKPHATPAKPLVSVNLESLIQDVKRRGTQKGRNAEEVEIMARTAARIAERIVADQIAALQPDTETPFSDAADAVRRLLPYHIFKHPEEDLRKLTGRKGKRKATEEDLIREEIAETKFAIDCWKRKTALERRLRRIRTNEGKRRAPDDQAYVLAQAALEAERSELTSLNAEYRIARAELDRVEREKKAAAAAAAAAAAPPPVPTPAPAPAPAPATPIATRLPYYTQTASSTPASMTTTFAQSPSVYTPQYRNYTYPYAQPYGTPYSYTPPATATASTSAPSRKTTPVARTPTNVPVLQLAPPSVAGSAPAAPSSAAPSGSSTPVSTATPTAPAPPIMAPIPVHLPVSSLMSLSALGIVPVPAANAPPADQPQPACVLKGTTNNGTMVSLEINVSALGQAQASGLAVLLSALTARSGAAATPAPAPSATDTSGTKANSQSTAGDADSHGGAG